MFKHNDYLPPGNGETTFDVRVTTMIFITDNEWEIVLIMNDAINLFHFTKHIKKHIKSM